MNDQAHLHDPVLLQKWFDTLARTIAVDFDGTLHPYTVGWVASVPEPEAPIVGAYDFLVNLHALGYRIVVFSCRADHPEGKQGIEDWLHDYGLGAYVDEVTHLKPPAIAYVDDRALTFDGSNWSEITDGIGRLAAGGPHGTGKGEA